MTELSFLLDLLMNHKLQKNTKELIVARIKEVEQQSNEQQPMQQQRRPLPLPPSISKQAPSTIAKMIQHGELPAEYQMPQLQDEPPALVEVVAHTPAAVHAMNSRQQAIAEAISGKIPKGQDRPRKF